MTELLSEPISSELFAGPRDLRVQHDASYLFAFSVEDRSRLAPDWMQRHPDVRFVELIPDDSTRAGFSWQSSGETGAVRLRSEKQLNEFLRALGRQTVYVDITGLPHFVWIPVIRAVLRLGLIANVVYAEPLRYVPGRNSSAAELYELSDRISNAEPLPGFASLARDVDPPVLISLLGFEGGRFARVQQIVQTSGDRTIPIIGVPGFEPEYPFIAYFANRLGLREADCWMNLAFASANCPFSLLAQLEHLATTRLPADRTIKVAMIGTKPHALGALLFFLRSERDVELIYDHPVRSAGRTKGSTRCWVYSVSNLDFRPDRLTSIV
jgi:hypothetical protein